MHSNNNSPVRRCIRQLTLVSSAAVFVFMTCTSALYRGTVAGEGAENTMTTGTSAQSTQQVMTTTTQTTQVATTSATTLQTSTLESSTSLTSTFSTTSTILPEMTAETIMYTEAVDEVTVAYDETYSDPEYIGGDGYYSDGYVFSSGLVKGSRDYILLCNCVGAEAGSDWIDEFEKACVAEVVLNRVESQLYPGTVFDVLNQEGQFQGASGYIYLDGYSYQVTESVICAVDMYLEEGYINNNHNYLSFFGDGEHNYFS